ncbi:subtilisin-like serine protease, partial [Modicella reniformis]
MRPQLVLLLGVAIAGVAFAVNAPAAPIVVVDAVDTQTHLAAPQDINEGMEALQSAFQKDKNSMWNAQEKDGYVFDPSKKSTRGYDVDGRQEAVNVGPGMQTTADGQILSRSGPRSRQRREVPPHKYIVRLKNGADYPPLDLHAKIAEHNRLIRLPPSTEKDKHELVPSQIDHEYDFGTWKGYAGQFSPDFVKELESREEVEYVEEDMMMWAWGIEAEAMVETVDGQGQVNDDEHKDLSVNHLAATQGNRSVSLHAEALLHAEAPVNGRNVHFEYYSMMAPSWGLTRVSQRQRDLREDYSYMSSAGVGVDVYIIDSGVFEEHEDFEGRAFNIANFVPGEERTDTCGHGTHVAGIIAGHHFGVAKAARIHAIKVLDSDGQGSTSQVLAGIDYMIQHAINNPNPKKVINMSLGGRFSRTVNDAVRAAVSQHGLPFFVAAGNTGDDACRYSPASAEGAFAVGASDRSDRIGWYSCVGSCVAMFGPGSGITSDWIRSPTSVHIMDGTSMASPHVAGVAALFLGAGNMYSSAQDLYKDLIAYSTQNAISGLWSNDQRTTMNLVYNKLEDLTDKSLIKSQDRLEAHGPEEKEDNVLGEKTGG